MNLKKHSALAGFVICAAALAWPLAASAQQTAAPATQQEEDETIVLSPFQVTTDKDSGYGATNSISGSRVNTPIKDIPLPILVITDQFINDIGATTLRVNSFHREAIVELGPRVRAVAHARDGVIEAVELDGAGFALGIQWHQELFAGTDHRGNRIFAGFAAACG